MKNKHLRIFTAALVFSLCSAPFTVAQAGSLSSQEEDTVSTGRTAAEDTDLTAAEETGVAATEETDISSSQKTASISSAADNETAQNAETAFREFLDESRSLIWHNDNVTFHFISQKNFFADGEEFMIRDLIDRVEQAAKNVTNGSKDSSLDILNSLPLYIHNYQT